MSQGARPRRTAQVDVPTRLLAELRGCGEAPQLLHAHLVSPACGDDGNPHLGAARVSGLTNEKYRDGPVGENYLRVPD